VNQKHVDSDAEIIHGVLRDVLGLNVSMITPSPEYKSPDLRIEFGGVTILTEVERKTDDQQFRNLLNGGKGATIQYSGARTEERVKNAWRQIRDYPNRRSSDSTLIWLIAGQRDATILTAKAAISRLYGVETLEGYTETGEYYSKPCYFFYESLFFKYKDLDAVVVHSCDDVTLCLNPHSARYVAWKTYSFLSAFSVVIDPFAEESMGAALFADCETDRTNTNKVVVYLRQKYQLRRPTITRFVLVNMPVVNNGKHSSILESENR
jgi:hypothetical protein